MCLMKRSRLQPQRLCFAVDDAISHINVLLLDDASAVALIEELKKPEACLPPVRGDFPTVHHRELFKSKMSKEGVRLVFCLRRSTYFFAIRTMQNANCNFFLALVLKFATKFF